MKTRRRSAPKKRTNRRTTRLRKMKGGEIEFIHSSSTKIDTLHDFTKTQMSQGDDAPMKPSGLWLSEGSDWIEMMGAEKYLYKAELDTSKLLKIDSVSSLKEFNSVYYNTSKKVIEWAKLYDEYPGIWISNYKEIKSSMMKDAKRMDYMWFFLIDVNSVCIWKPSYVVKSFVEYSANNNNNI